MDWNCSGRYELNINKLLLTIGVDQHQKKLSQDVMSHPFLETRRSREPYGSADWSVLPHKVLSLVTLCPCFGQYNRPLIWWRSRLSSFPLPFPAMSIPPGQLGVWWFPYNMAPQTQAHYWIQGWTIETVEESNAGGKTIWMGDFLRDFQWQSWLYLIATKNTGVFLGTSNGKESACNAGDPGSISGPGGSPGEGHGSPLQYSCLENSMDRGVWQSMGSQRVRHDWVINTDTPQTLPTIPPTPCWQWFLCVPSYFCFIRRHPSTACNTISNKRPA